MMQRFLKLLLILGGAGGISLLGCGALGTADSGLGDTTTREAVVHALESTDYFITYRRVPRLEGYEMVAGRARDKRGDVVDFSVVLNSAGRIVHNPESRRGGSPQFPVVRYSENAGSAVGNLNMVTQQQSAYVLRRVKSIGETWTAKHAETRMAIRIEAVLYRLFAPGVREGP